MKSYEIQQYPLPSLLSPSELAFPISQRLGLNSVCPVILCPTYCLEKHAEIKNTFDTCSGWYVVIV